MADGEPLGRDYTMHEELGRGAIGVVRRTTRNGGGPPLAAKLLHQRFAGDRDVLRLFLQEEASLRQVKHESIVGLVDVVYERGRLALLMELVDGPTLRRYLTYRGGTLTPSEACSIATQTAAGLAAMHAQGVVHLDLKPENILLEQGTQPLRAKIGDFGIAELLMNAGRGRDFPAGTASYTAPEILAGEAPSAAADVFALGVTLTEMVTGARPDPLTKGAEPPAGLPEPLRSLIGQCLAADPRDRPKARTVSALLRQTAPQLAHTPRRPPTAPLDPPPPTHLRANRTPNPEPDRAHRHPKRGLLIVIAAALAVLLLGGVGTAILASKPWHDPDH